MMPPTEEIHPPKLADPRSWLDRLWASLATRGGADTRQPTPTLPLQRATCLAEALLSERGEATGAVVARELRDCLHTLGTEDRFAFHQFLATGFQPEASRLRAAAEAYLAEPSAEMAARLAAAAEPPRQELLRRMNMTPGGTALVAMREELASEFRSAPELRQLDFDLKHLFASWFNPGFLELRRIDWQSPAAVLEKLIAYEAVHEIQGWDDLRRRLASDRRCFGFFHPALTGEPLIFVEVALVEGLATAVEPLLARDGDDDKDTARTRAARADTAIFYSISNCQEGLRGISFGNFLIKQVVEDLKAELPRLTRFATLSPVPGFRHWLRRRLDRAGTETAGTATFREDEAKELIPSAGDTVTSVIDVFRVLADNGDWWRDAAHARVLRGPLMRLCAEYLTRPNKGIIGTDAVARFHLGNGPRLERINWLGNTSPRGIEESCGIMVNYLYDPDTIEANHEAFAQDGTIVRSPDVDSLLASSK